MPAVSVDAARPVREPGSGWRGAGLRPVLTALSTGLVALVSALLLWLGWLLVGGVANAVPALPPGSRVRVGGLVVPAEQVSAAVGNAMQAEVLRAGLIAFPLVVLAAGVVSWWLVGRVLGPLHAVTATARRLSVESLDTRLALRDARGEVADLAAGFDAMLDRLQAAFDAQRRFVANASHELRTPLAVLRTEVDVTLADPDADVAELRRMGEVVREATRRADELIAGLLLLARSEVPSAVDPAAVRAVDLADVVVPALAATRAEATRRGLRVTRAPRTGADGGRPGAARTRGREPRRERGATQRAGGLGGDPDGAARAGRGAARQFRGTGDRSGAGGGAFRAVPARTGRPHGRHAGLRAGPLDRPGGGARPRRDGGRRTGTGRGPGGHRAPPGTHWSTATNLRRAASTGRRLSGRRVRPWYWRVPAGAATRALAARVRRPGGPGP